MIADDGIELHAAPPMSMAEATRAQAVLKIESHISEPAIRCVSGASKVSQFDVEKGANLTVTPK
jgi:hypothetical protein